MPDRKKCVTRWVLLAVVFFTLQFRSIFLGRPFLLRADHGTGTSWNLRARWLARLQEFDFTIVHRSGRRHSKPGSLSRLLCRQCVQETHGEQVTIATTSLIETEDIRQLQLNDLMIGLVFKSKLQNSKPPNPELKAYSRATRRLCQIWDQLLMRDDKLYRQYQKKTTNLLL